MFFKEEEFNKLKQKQNDYLNYYDIFKEIENGSKNILDEYINKSNKKSVYESNNMTFVFNEKENRFITTIINKEQKEVVKVINNDPDYIYFSVFNYIEFEDYEIKYDLDIHYIKNGKSFIGYKKVKFVNIKDELITSPNVFSFYVNRKNKNIKLNLQTQSGFNVLSEDLKELLNENLLTLHTIDGENTENLNLIQLSGKLSHTDYLISYNLKTKIFENYKLINKDGSILYKHENDIDKDDDFKKKIEDILSDLKMYEDIQYKI